MALTPGYISRNYIYVLLYMCSCLLEQQTRLVPPWTILKTKKHQSLVTRDSLSPHRVLCVMIHAPAFNTLLASSPDRCSRHRPGCCLVQFEERQCAVRGSCHLLLLLSSLSIQIRGSMHGATWIHGATCHGRTPTPTPGLSY